MKKAKSAKGMSLPKVPVSAQFTMDGLMLTVVEGKKLYHSILSWKDLYKLGKKGKKMAAPEMVKEMTDKLDEMMKQRAADEARRQKTFEELKGKYGPNRPAVPMPPVMPVPEYRRPTVQAAPSAPLVQDPMAPPPPPPPSATGT